MESILENCFHTVLHEKNISKICLKLLDRTAFNMGKNVDFHIPFTSVPNSVQIRNHRRDAFTIEKAHTYARKIMIRILHHFKRKQPY